MISNSVPYSVSAQACVRYASRNCFAAAGSEDSKCSFRGVSNVASVESAAGAGGCQMGHTATSQMIEKLPDAQ